MPFQGGYTLLKRPLVKWNSHRHTAANPEGVSDDLLRAVNLVQATPWRVNNWTLSVMKDLWLAGDELEALPTPYNPPIPEQIPSDLWAQMDKAARNALTNQRRRAHVEINELTSKRVSLLQKMRVGDKMKDEERIWLPHFIDFRGRLYPMPVGLNQQGDDIAKSLLMFAEGRPLTEAGVSWLAIRLANCAGLDKESFDKRIEWVVENERDIRRSAQDPVNYRWWAEAAAGDDPWQFLATCHEWEQAHRLPRAADFISHLPIPVDGTCNGLQHLSLAARDPAGALATNCSAHPERKDVYQEVADRAAQLVANDAAAGVEEALHWVGSVTRKTVKRAVMTTPYGVTARGIQNQLINDGITRVIEGPQSRNAQYMEAIIGNALDTTIARGKEVMGWLQDCAQIMALHDEPVRWDTPLLQVTQAYHNFHLKRVKTLVGSTTISFKDEVEDPDLGLHKHKQSLAVAPNVVHSWDAAHLCMTAMRMNDEENVASFSFVHDSYGVHACHTTRLNRVLREEAVRLHEADQLRLIEEKWHATLPADVAAELPPRPEAGDFNIREVIEAPYFFA